MSVSVREGALFGVLSVLPGELRRELEALVSGGCEISELRLRAIGISQAVIGGRSYPLFYRATHGVLRDVLSRLCRGSLYAYRDSIADGYVSGEWGVRVGVVGEARYEGERAVGVDGVSSLCFRIPTGRCEVADGLYETWRSLGGGSMLIASPPAGGKTTALRALARLIGSGEQARRVVAVDERLEFIPEDYAGASVDLLRGYKRERGVELALRTMSPEIIMVDEIGSAQDARATETARGAGVSLIATAHARDLADARKRRYISEMLDGGAFDIFVRLWRDADGAYYEARRLDE